jgi:hypothetical protein
MKRRDLFSSSLALTTRAWANVIPFPSRDSASPVARIGRRERLGGLLSFYERNAA